MRILFIVPRFHLNLRMRVKALHDAGHDVSVIAFKSSSIMEEHDVLAPHIVEEGYVSSFVGRIAEQIWGSDGVKKMMYTWRTPRILRTMQYLRSCAPEVIFVRAQQNMFTLVMMALARVVQSNIYLLAQVDKHCADSYKKNILLFFLQYVVGIRGIISPLKNRCVDTHVLYEYVPFVVDVPKKTRHISENGQLRILTVGKFQERKDILLLLHVFRDTVEQYDITLTIVGNTYDPVYERDVYLYIQKHNLEDSVCVMKDVPHGEMSEIFGVHDIFVLPSYNEPAAYAPLEAMAHGLPVIVSDTCGTRCYVEEGSTGYIFTSKDKTSLQDSLVACVEDRARLIIMGEEARRAVSKYHVSDRYTKHIESIMANRNV